MNTVLICGGEINDEFSLVCIKADKAGLYYRGR